MSPLPPGPSPTVDVIIEIAGTGRYRFVEWPPEKKAIDVGSIYSDSSRLAAAVGWAPQVSLHDGLARTLAFYRAHLAHYLGAAEDQAATS